jgi:hypothetical protein
LVAAISPVVVMLATGDDGASANYLLAIPGKRLRAAPSRLCENAEAGVHVQ